MRLDKWLKVSRLIKRRTVANEACDNQRVSVGGRSVRASYEVKPGDVVELRFGERVTRIEVLSVADNVGKSDAAAMYRELN
ncbi:RNA-binding S4 domain-containing protein [Intestinimonas butyriciproducens]|uniref:RNA-binding S4 domain-containing protein n=1 Tax=Intestinimonas butyriciproducens TaxID=1297617 RepID=UPI001956E1DD|nr:RNA-binding S4 domain-containing protein [Intestinimonas butyriciproducens]MBM6976282.1 RNA-binding S4 domain-containing protein [Intestinimonas butyriciproducens]